MYTLTIHINSFKVNKNIYMLYKYILGRVVMEAGLAEAAAVDARSEAVSPARIFWATWTGWMLDAFDSAAYGLLLV